MLSWQPPLQTANISAPTSPSQCVPLPDGLLERITQTLFEQPERQPPSYSLRKPPHSASSQPCWQTDTTRSSESQWLHTGVPDGRWWRLRERTAEWSVQVVLKQKRLLRCVCGWSSGRYMAPPALRWLTASVMKVWHCWIVLFCTDIAHWLRYAVLLFLLQRNRCQVMYAPWMCCSRSINNYTLTLTNLIFLTVASIILRAAPGSLVLTSGSVL